MPTATVAGAHVVPVYAAVLALLFVHLSLRVIRLRRVEQAPVGMGESQLLQRAIRAQANFAEYVPIALVLLFFVETAHYPLWVVHVLGAALLVGRAVHAWGVSREESHYRHRIWGMRLTIGMLIASAVLLFAPALGLDLPVANAAG